VVVQNFAGSVTGLMASVTVATPVRAAVTLVSSNGLPFFRLTGGAGRNYVIEASTNLVHWMALYTNSATFGPVQFFNPPSPSLSRRFYRIVPWP
jgi:hypothetical protein